MALHTKVAHAWIEIIHLALLRMRLAFVIASLMSLGSVDAHARQLPNLVPQGWELTVTNDEARSRQFISPQGDSTLTTHQTAATRGGLRGDIDRIAFHDGEQITYLKRAPTWVAVSGYRDGKIFYRKSNLACGGTRWNQVELVYPKERKRSMDGIVTRIAHGMPEYAGDCR
jgi:hypothetical protein